MSTVERLATFVAETRLDRIPVAVLERARLQAVSAVAAARAGVLEPGVRKVCSHLRDRPGPVRLLATGTPVSLHAAVVGNATASCAFDWDEILLLAHPSHSAVGVAWALGEAHDHTLGEVLAAQVIASELSGRLGLACFFGPQNGQHQPFLHHLGGAAAAARLLGLRADATADALSIALAQPQTALWPAFVGAIESKALTAAHPAEQGLSAAEHAAAGVRGPRHVLDHPRGFFHRFTFLPAPRALTGLGRTWLLHTLQVKEHAACWYFQAPVDALLRLRSEADPPLDPTTVRRIQARVTLLGSAVHGLARQTASAASLLPNTVNFRLDYSLGLALLHGALHPAVMTEPRLRADQEALRRLAAVTRVTHDVEHSRATVAAVHAALDVPALLDAGPLAVATALGRARREFSGLGGLGAGELVPLSGELWRAARQLATRRHDSRSTAPYDLGRDDIAEAVQTLTLPCGATVTLELADGRSRTARVDVPGGAIRDPAAGRAVLERKLRVALAATEPGREREAEAILSGFLDAPLHTPVRTVLDRLHG